MGLKGGRVSERYCEGVCIRNIVLIIAQHTNHRCFVSYTANDLLATAVSWSDRGIQEVTLGSR